MYFNENNQFYLIIKYMSMELLTTIPYQFAVSLVGDTKPLPLNIDFFLRRPDKILH